MEPVSLLRDRSRPVALPWASVVTPYHSPTGASLSQLSALFQSDPPVASKKVTSTSRVRSPDGIPSDGSGDAPQVTVEGW